MHNTALSCTALHFTVVQCTTQNCTSLHYTAPCDPCDLLRRCGCSKMGSGSGWQGIYVGHRYRAGKCRSVDNNNLASGGKPTNNNKVGSRVVLIYLTLQSAAFNIDLSFYMPLNSLAHLQHLQRLLTSLCQKPDSINIF